MTALLVFLLLAAVSLLLRIQNKMRTLAHEYPEEAKKSPFSEALQELVATAGGIYVSLILLTSFLKIEAADTWQIFGIEMESLASVAIALALIQPLVLRAWHSLKGGR